MDNGQMDNGQNQPLKDLQHLIESITLNNYPHMFNIKWFNILALLQICILITHWKPGVSDKILSS